MQHDLYASISAMSYALPESVLDNEQLSLRFPEWNTEKIAKKTGILKRHICKQNETALDLGVVAAKKLFNSNPDLRNKIDGVLFCTESPDYCLPPNACLAQDILGLSQNIPATDYNLGCSGFVFGLSIAYGWILSRIAKCVLLITADTYSKYLAENDKTVRTIFGDAATATVIEATSKPGLSNFVFATDGRGAQNLIVPLSGARRFQNSFCEHSEFYMEGRTPNNLYMNGPKLFQFTLHCVSDLLTRCLTNSSKLLDDIDHFVLHQANLFMLEHIRIKCGIPKEKFIVDMSDIGNTVSSSIPIAIQRSLENGVILPGETIFLAGFGVGYSACAALLTINGPLR